MSSAPKLATACVGRHLDVLYIASHRGKCTYICRILLIQLLGCHIEINACLVLFFFEAENNKDMHFAGKA